MKVTTQLSDCFVYTEEFEDYQVHVESRLLEVESNMLRELKTLQIKQRRTNLIMCCIFGICVTAAILMSLLI